MCFYAAVTFLCYARAALRILLNTIERTVPVFIIK
jgi:hypothetical protein